MQKHEPPSSVFGLQSLEKVQSFGMGLSLETPEAMKMEFSKSKQSGRPSTMPKLTKHQILNPKP